MININWVKEKLRVTNQVPYKFFCFPFCPYRLFLYPIKKMGAIRFNFVVQIVATMFLGLGTDLKNVLGNVGKVC